jgi:hypothetical protein
MFTVAPSSSLTKLPMCSTLEGLYRPPSSKTCPPSRPPNSPLSDDPPHSPAPPPPCIDHFTLRHQLLCHEPALHPPFLPLPPQTPLRCLLPRRTSNTPSHLSSTAASNPHISPGPTPPPPFVLPRRSPTSCPLLRSRPFPPLWAIRGAISRRRGCYVC